MNLFGTELGSAQIMALVGLVATLVLWLFALRGERNYARWFKAWEADRKSKRDPKPTAGDGVNDPPRGGPWG